jgi:hypothetical protein
MMSRQYVYNGSVKKQDNDDKEDKKENKIYYKILNSDWTCRGYQYKLGGTYSIPEEDLVLCQCGFHCCEHPLDCLEFYSSNPSNRYAEVKMLGKIVTSKPDDDPKCASNILKIEREIPYQEWLELCTVMVSRWSGGYYEENYWVKGKLSERRIFYSNGNKKAFIIFPKEDDSPRIAILKSISYFQNGMEHFIQTRSELCYHIDSILYYHIDSILYYESGRTKLTQIWVRKEGRLECIRTPYDEQGNTPDEELSEIMEEVRREEDFIFRS